MNKYDIDSFFNLKGKVIAITGGTGVLGSEIACALAEAGAEIAIMDIKSELSDDIKNRLDQRKVNMNFSNVMC